MYDLNLREMDFMVFLIRILYNYSFTLTITMQLQTKLHKQSAPLVGLNHTSKKIGPLTNPLRAALTNAITPHPQKLTHRLAT